MSDKNVTASKLGGEEEQPWCYTGSVEGGTGQLLRERMVTVIIKVLLGLFGIIQEAIVG